MEKLNYLLLDIKNLHTFIRQVVFYQIWSKYSFLKEVELLLVRHVKILNIVQEPVTDVFTPFLIKGLTT